MGITEEENRKIQELVATPLLEWLDGGSGASGGGGSGGVSSGNRSVKSSTRRSHAGRPITTPPEGYVCRRCSVAGHFIQHCPTNGDPSYDIKIMRPATGIPKTMLQANQEGRYVLRSGESAVLKPNEDLFDKEMEGVPSKRPAWSVDDIPPDLLCPLCKKLMKDAALTSKCCFKSFCDKCIRDHLIRSRMKCHCGATDMLADFLIPNVTVRRAINRILECGTSSSSSSGSSGGGDSKSIYFQVQGLGSALHCPSVQTKVKASATLSAVSSLSNEDHNPTWPVIVQDTANVLTSAAQKMRAAESADISEAAIAPTQMKKETVSQENVQVADEVIEYKKLISGELGKKKRKRDAAQDLDDYDNSMMMPTGSCQYNPYWSGMWAGMEGYGAPYYSGAMDGYGYDHFGLPFGVSSLGGSYSQGFPE